MAINESTQGVRAAAYKFILKNRKSINPDMTKKDCSNLYSAFIKQTTNQDTSVTRHNFNEMFATWFSLAAAKFEKNLNVQTEGVRYKILDLTGDKELADTFADAFWHFIDARGVIGEVVGESIFQTLLSHDVTLDPLGGPEKSQPYKLDKPYDMLPLTPDALVTTRKWVSVPGIQPPSDESMLKFLEVKFRNPGTQERAESLINRTIAKYLGKTKRGRLINGGILMITTPGFKVDDKLREHWAQQNVQIVTIDQLTPEQEARGLENIRSHEYGQTLSRIGIPLAKATSLKALVQPVISPQAYANKVMLAMVKNPYRSVIMPNAREKAYFDKVVYELRLFTEGYSVPGGEITELLSLEYIKNLLDSEVEQQLKGRKKLVTISQSITDNLLNALETMANEQKNTRLAALTMHLRLPSNARQILNSEILLRVTEQAEHMKEEKQKAEIEAHLRAEEQQRQKEAGAALEKQRRGIITEVRRQLKAHAVTDHGKKALNEQLATLTKPEERTALVPALKPEIEQTIDRKS